MNIKVSKSYKEIGATLRYFAVLERKMSYYSTIKPDETASL